MDSSNNEEDIQPGFIKRTLQIPCLRDSLMYGIGGGLGFGLAHFLFTSNVSRATNVGIGGYVVIFFGTWGLCRYKFAQDTFKAIQVQKAMMKKTGNPNIQLVDPKDV